MGNPALLGALSMSDSILVANGSTCSVHSTFPSGRRLIEVQVAARGSNHRKGDFLVWYAEDEEPKKK
jgi:hypothetical protein